MMLKDKIQRGDRFGRLRVTGTPYRDSAWKVEVTCNCGVVKYVVLYSLSAGLTRSCGCFQRDQNRNRLLRHGMTGTRLWTCWRNMIGRCSYAGQRTQNRVYREKKIIVCLAWKKFESFRDWALTHGYRSDLEIDRVDGTKGYAPANCRFVGEVTQSRNTARRRDNVSGFIGVSYNKRDCVYNPRVRRCGKSHHLGTFRDSYSAAWVRDAYVRQRGDVDATLNNLKDRRKHKKRVKVDRRGTFDWKKVLSK